MRLSCFGSEYKMAEHFTCFTANPCLKTEQEQQEDNSMMTSAIWSIFADLNSPLSPKLQDKQAQLSR